MTLQTLKPEFEQLIDPQAEIETIAEGHIFTEGPLWDPRHKRLLFSDIPADTIYSWSQGKGVEVYRRPSSFSNGLTFNRRGDLIACEHQSRSISITQDGAPPKMIASQYQGKKLNSPNDVISANDGAILFTDPIYGLRDGQGGPADQELPFQGVYLIEAGSGNLRLLTDSFERPNGLSFSPDEKILYVGDTVRQHIRKFEVGAGWQFNGGQVWVELWDDGYTGRPDGMKVDESGNLFSAGPGGIWVFDPQGALLGRIFLPDKTSNLAWGDDDLRSLFITCSSKVYRIRCLTRGMPLIH